MSPFKEMERFSNLVKVRTLLLTVLAIDRTIGWLNFSRNNSDFELRRPIFSTPSLYWLGDMVNHSES
ncbi:13686_t:CDS:1, partial [Acaulospora colombiana]